MVAAKKVNSGGVYEFDEFRIDTETRRLFRRGEPVALHGKAFEMLQVLVVVANVVLQRAALKWCEMTLNSAQRGCAHDWLARVQDACAVSAPLASRRVKIAVRIAPTPFTPAPVP